MSIPAGTDLPLLKRPLEQRRAITLYCAENETLSNLSPSQCLLVRKWLLFYNLLRKLPVNLWDCFDELVVQEEASPPTVIKAQSQQDMINEKLSKYLSEPLIN
nr:hypothetical protein BgiMline_035007 [Biomphalaria glabrata]